MIKKASIICIMIVLLLHMAVFANTFYVGEDQDCQSITESVIQAEDGDEIVICGGIYDETRETFPIEIDKCLYIHAAEGEEVLISSPLTFVTIKLRGAGSKIEGINFEFLRSACMHILANDIIVDNCRFRLGDPTWRETSCGMWIASAKNVTVRNSEFFDSSIAMAGPPIDMENPNKSVPVLTALFEVGEDVEYFTTHTIENNFVNGRPLEYIIGLTDQEYTSDCGELLAVCCDNVTFRDLDVSCASIGFQLAYSNNCTVTDCCSDDSGIFGIYLAKCDDCCISNVHSDNGSHGIDLRDCNRCVVENCESSDSGQGIFLAWHTDCIVRNCQMVNNGTGFYSSRGDDLLIDDCLMEGNELGLYVQAGSFFTLSNSEVRNNSSCGLRMTDNEADILDNLFADNLVGTLAIDSTYTHVIGNTFTGTTLNDLYFKDSINMDYEGNVFSEGLEETVVIEETGS